MALQGCHWAVSPKRGLSRGVMLVGSLQVSPPVRGVRVEDVVVARRPGRLGVPPTRGVRVVPKVGPDDEEIPVRVDGHRGRHRLVDRVPTRRQALAPDGTALVARTGRMVTDDACDPQRHAPVGARGAIRGSRGQLADQHLADQIRRVAAHKTRHRSSRRAQPRAERPNRGCTRGRRRVSKLMPLISTPPDHVAPPSLDRLR